MSMFSLADLWAAPCWLLANWLLIAAAWRWCGRLFPHDDILARAMHAIIVSWATVAIVCFALSAIGCLLPTLLLASVGGLSALALYHGARLDRADAPWRGSHRRARPALGPRRERAWVLTWLWCASVAATAVVVYGLLEFPDDWDSLAYHIPLVDQWLRAKNLNSTHCSSWFHPGNNELLGLWCVGIFSGDFLIGLSNSAPAAALALGTRELTRRLGARSAMAHLAGFAALTPNVVTRQLLDCENDVAVAALFVTSLAYGVRFAHRPRRAPLLLWTLSFGLLPGVKYYALGYTAVAGVGVTLLAMRSRSLRAAIAVAGAGLVGAAGLSGYWYLRNYRLTGTPIYPQGFLGSPDFLADIFPYLRQTTLVGNRSPVLAPLLVRSIWSWLGAAHCIAFLAVPMTTAWLIFPGLRRGVKGRRNGQAMLACSILAGAAVFSTTPFVVETAPGTFDMLIQGYLPARFLLLTSTLAVVAVCLCLDAISIGMRRRTADAAERARPLFGKCMNSPHVALSSWPLWLFAIAALSQIRPGRRGPEPEDALTILFAGTDMFLLLVLVADISRDGPTIRLRRKWRLSALLGGSLVVSALGARWHAGFAQFYDILYQTRIFTKLEAGGAEDARLCALAYRTYPFFGSRRQYEVFGPMFVQTYDDLNDYVLRHRPDRVVTITNDLAGPHRYDRIATWVDEHGELFKRTNVDYRFSIYRTILPDE